MGRRCGRDRLYSNYGDLWLGFHSLGMWLSLPCFSFGWHCPSSGVSCPCQPASHEHHGEFAQSRSLLPNLSTNEETNSWDGCSLTAPWLYPWPHPLFPHPWGFGVQRGAGNGMLQGNLLSRMTPLTAKTMHHKAKLSLSPA